MKEVAKEIEFFGPLEQFFWDEDSKICLLEGAAGTGKTFCYLHKIFRVAEENPGVRIVLSRKERVDLTEAVLAPFEQDVIPKTHPAKPGYRDAQRANRKMYRFPNGSEILCYGLTDRSDNDEEEGGKFKSTQFDIWVIEEATEASYEEIQIAFSRLRADGIEWKQLILPFNPPSDPNHHIYNFIGKPGVSYYKTVHEDNPKYWVKCSDGDTEHPVTKEKGKWTPKGKQYIQEILGNLDGGMRDRFLDGKNAYQPGLVHPEYSSQIHFVTRKEGTFLDYVQNLNLSPSDKTKYIRDNYSLDLGIDWGTGHPLVIEGIISPKNPGEQFDSRDWKYRRIFEFYQTRTVADEAARMLLQYCGYSYDEDTCEISYAENELGFVIPLFDEYLQQYAGIYTDHSLESRMLFDRASGLNCYPACKTVDAGLAMVSRILRDQEILFDEVEPIGGIDYYQNRQRKPTGIHMEFSRYKFQKGPQGYGRNPIRQNDDGCTALRYVLAEKEGLRDKVHDVKSYRSEFGGEIDYKVVANVVGLSNHDRDELNLFGEITNGERYLF